MKKLLKLMMCVTLIVLNSGVVLADYIPDDAKEDILNVTATVIPTSPLPDLNVNIVTAAASSNEITAVLYWRMQGDKGSFSPVPMVQTSPDTFEATVMIFNTYEFYVITENGDRAPDAGVYESPQVGATVVFSDVSDVLVEAPEFQGVVLPMLLSFGLVLFFHRKKI